MSAELLALLWLMFLLIAVAWLLSALGVLPALRMLDGMRDPGVRARRVLLTASMPCLVPATLGAAVFATAGSKAVGWITDHCPHHGLGHPHLCFSHLPGLDLGLIHGAFAAAVGLPLVYGLARLMLSEYRARTQLTVLAALAARRGLLRIVSGAAPLALAGGLFRPMVVLSRGLLNELSLRERRIVLAHEAAHLRHGDAPRNVLFEVLLRLHFPVARRRLRQAWLSALEERADDVVACRFGAEPVVETLLHVARLKLHQPVPGFSVAGANLRERVRRLLDGECGTAVGAPVFEAACALVLTALFTAAIAGHHALETLLGFLTGH